MGTKRVFIFVWLLIGLAFGSWNPLVACPTVSPQSNDGKPTNSFFPPTKKRSSSQFRSIGVGFPRQQDPFGENQSQGAVPKTQDKPGNQSNDPSKPAIQPKPAGNVFGEDQGLPKVEPKMKPPAQPVPEATELQLEPAQTNEIPKLPRDPFADPPKQNAAPNPVPGSQQDPQPSAVQPEPGQRNSVVEPPAIDPGMPDAPGQFVEPTVQPEQRPPVQNDPVVPVKPKTDSNPASPEDIQVRPRQEQARPQVKRPQPARYPPPHVKGPNRFRPSYMPTQVYQPPQERQPLFKPDFQPIPGLPAQPVYSPHNYPVVQQSQPLYSPRSYPPANQTQPLYAPRRYPPANNSRVYAPPEISSNESRSVITESAIPSSVVQSQGVYSDSVASTLGSGCNSCDSGSGACNSGCPNFYVSVFGGYTGQRGLDGYSGSREISADGGGGVGVALGRRNGRNLRTEAEFSFRSNHLTDFVTSPMPAPGEEPVSGEINAYAGMANAYWEFINIPNRCFKPYVGVGVGFVGINAVIRDPLSRNLVPSSARSDSSFAYQWIGGVNYKAYRNMDVFMEYRMFNADTYRIDPSVPGLGDRYSFKTDNVFAGMRWKF